MSRLIVRSATDFAIITVDAAGMVISWNAGAERLFGWSAAQAIGKHGRIIFTPEDQKAGSPEHEMQRADLDGRAEDERWHMRADGSRFWGSGLMMPLKPDGDGAGEPEWDEAPTATPSTGYLKIIRDRTAQRTAERRFQTLTDALPGFVFACDTDGHNVQVNEYYRRYTGRSDEELLGDRWLEAVHEDDRQRARERWMQVARSGSPPYVECYRYRRHDGIYREFECRAVPERDDDGRVVRWIGTCVDVNDAVHAQRQLEVLNRGLEHAVNERTAELERESASRLRAEEALRQSQKMEAIGQLTGGVAHDFNNLLTVIRGGADMLLRPGIAEERRQRFAAAIRDTAERAAKLTGQLLAFARRQALKPELFDVATQIENLGDVLKSLLGSRVELVVDDRCGGCVVEADPNQFDTALVNMAANARDAMAGSGRLVVTIEATDRIPPRRGHAAAPGDFVAVKVADTGEGIAADVLDRVFEPFFTTKGVGKGTGLGLSQVFGFAKQSGGEVTVESTAGAGTTFTLYLPRARQRPAAVNEAHDRVAAMQARGRVLIVEDNEVVGEFACQLLHELGYAATLAANGQEALDTLHSATEPFDAVFTDVVMPGISGLDLARQLQRERPGLPVVLTSGYSHVLAQEGTHGFELLQKPYSADALVRVLRKVMA